MIIFNFTLFLQFVAWAWGMCAAMYVMNGLWIEKDSTKGAASIIIGAIMILILIVCMVF